VPFVDKLLLIGPPRSGKTTVGKAIANRAGLSFFDADQELLAHYAPDSTISECYEKWGACTFREKEQEVTKALLEKEKGIFSLGGGAVLQKTLRSLIKSTGLVLFLDVQKEELLERYRKSPPFFMLNLSDLERMACIEERRKFCLELADCTFFIKQGLTREAMEEQVWKEVYRGCQ
jgi:shikimate kinase